ncbi:hypothetical protein [Actinosynnema sp. NPDC020468]|uniref:hypothetical protein n=1 Tax=Actinosynnema sp. NPDC020468 TaxID=3154488 RepID=UPI0033EDD113
MAASDKIESPRTATAERITVALIAKVTEELRRVQERTGLSKTDAVNRAISVYEFLDAQLAAGNELVLRHPDTGREQLVRLL